MSASHDNTAALTPREEARVRELASEVAASMIAQILLGAGDRIAEAINGAIVMLPVLHIDEVADHGE